MFFFPVRRTLILLDKSYGYYVLKQDRKASVRIRKDRIHSAEDYMDNMVQFAPNQGVDPVDPL